MKSGQIHGPAKKKIVAGGRVGVLTGVMLFAVSMPLSLGTTAGRTEGRPGARSAAIGRDLPDVAAPPQYLVAQARDTVVPPIKRQSPKIPEAPPTEPSRKPAAGAAPPSNSANDAWPSAELGMGDWIQDWLARANREFQTTVIRRLSTAPAGGASDDEIARKLEEVKKQDARAAAAKRAQDARKEEERKAAEAKQAEQLKRQAAEAKRQRKAREAAAKAAQKAAEEATRKAAAEAAQKAAEEAKAKPPPPPLPQPAAKPEDSARLAEEMRQERARLEAEAKRIEEDRKAAEAKRYAEERTQDEARIAEDRRRAAAAESEKNRTRKIILTTEPIPRAEPQSAEARLQPPKARGNPRADSSASASGPVVRRWVWRTGNRRCRHAGRRVTPPRRYYTVRHGDSLWLISKRHYHTGWRYRKIYRANRSIIRDPDRIYPCQRIFVPRRH